MAKKPKLYEFTSMVSYSVVVLAVSEEDAREHISTWEQCWPTSSDFVGVSDVDLHDVRACKSADDEAHEITAKAAGLHRTKPKGKRGEQ